MAKVWKANRPNPAKGIETKSMPISPHAS